MFCENNLKRYRKVLSYEALEEKIRLAFSDVPYPGDENIISTPEHRAICEECTELYNFLVGKTWEEIIKLGPSHLGHAQVFLRPKGWHYYLPAYLIEGLLLKNISSWHLYDLIGRNSRREERGILLSPKQCEAILEYLKACSIKSNLSEREIENNEMALAFCYESYRIASSAEFG